MTRVELTVDRIAVGGRGLGRDPDGRVVFVAGAIPPERVVVELTRERAAHAEGTAVEVLDPSPDRLRPRCPHAERDCGGCDWQFVAPGAQRRLRVAMVEDALRRIGHVDTAAIELASGPEVPAVAYRTGVRMLVGADGRLAYRRRRSHQPFSPDACLVTHPHLEELIVTSRFPGAEEVRLRVSVATGERMAILARPSSAIDAPGDLLVTDRRHRPRRHLHEDVAGTRLRISAGSFFQASPAGAAALVTVVGQALAGLDGHLVDLYGGIGLFAATVGSVWERVTLVESNRAAVADAAVNAPETGVVRSRVERWRPEPADAVIADPSRSGLGADGASAVAATGAPVVVLVSCDAGSLGRDAALLGQFGFRPVSSTVLDLFHQTSHIEAVTVFRR